MNLVARLLVPVLCAVLPPAFALLYVQQEASRDTRDRLEREALAQAETEADRARLVCDALARMTDGAATKMHRRLFDADFHSITDLG